MIRLRRNPLTALALPVALLLQAFAGRFLRRRTR
jgi:hypothetical protein